MPPLVRAQTPPQYCVQDATSKRLLTISIWKRAIGYFQTLGTIQTVLNEMPLVQSVFSFLSRLTSIAFPRTAAMCAFPSLDYYDLFWVYVSLPTASIALTFFAYLYDWTLACRPWHALRLTPEQRKIVRARLITRGRTVGEILVTTSSVVLLFLYPTLNRATARMNKCVGLWWWGQWSGDVRSVCVCVCVCHRGRGGGREVLERPYTGGGGSTPPPWTPLLPPLPMFEADSHNFASVPRSTGYGVP